MFTGVVIEESLENKDVLQEFRITDSTIEKVTNKHATPRLSQWTKHTVEIPDDNIDETAEMISSALEQRWYADFKNDQWHYIIYKGKMFKVDLRNPVLYKHAKQYGISLGIPEYQVDFAPDDEVWER